MKVILWLAHRHVPVVAVRACAAGLPSRNPRSVVAPALIACQISLNASMLTSTASKPEATPSSNLRHIQTADKTIFTQIDHMEEDEKEWAVK